MANKHSGVFLSHKEEGNDDIFRKVGRPGDKHRFIETPVWNPDDERLCRVMREQK